MSIGVHEYVTQQQRAAGPTETGNKVHKGFFL